MHSFFNNYSAAVSEIDEKAYEKSLVNECKSCVLSLEENPPYEEMSWQQAIIVYMAHMPLFVKQPSEAVEEMLANTNNAKHIFIRVGKRTLLEIPVLLLYFTVAHDSEQKQETLPTVRIVSNHLETTCRGCNVNLDYSTLHACSLCQNYFCLQCMHHFECNHCHHSNSTQCENCDNVYNEICQVCSCALCDMCFQEHSCYCNHLLCYQFAWECYREHAYKFVRLLAS